MIKNYSNYHRDNDYRKFSSMFRNIFMKRLILINRLIERTPGRVIDIGCSTGVFLDLFKESGWETWGVEPSKSGIIAKKKGHKVINDYFEKGVLPKNYFDLVIMNHTLEHMDNPAKVLTSLHGLLKSNGSILVDVPNAGGFGARILGEYWPYRLPDEHKSQFTRASLTAIFRTSGFKVIHFESRSGLFEYADPFLEVWSSLIGLKKRFFFDVLSFPYALIVTLLNSGDSMSLVGVKVIK